MTAPLSTDPRLAELREHVALNYTTDARVAIAWAVHEIEQLRGLLQGLANCTEFRSCELCRDLLKPYLPSTR
jgi:hypothetical protein